MQSSSSVPVLILVLCCMASAHNAKERQSCNFPDNYPQRCLYAIFDLIGSNLTDLNSALDTLCNDTTCSDHSDQLDTYYECLLGIANYSEFLCTELQDGQYCHVIREDYLSSCLLTKCLTRCNDDCRSCLDDFVDDISCCGAQYQRLSSVPDYAVITTDVCRNSYDTCSGGAIAVPTVLTALLLMVMAAIAMI